MKIKREKNKWILEDGDQFVFADKIKFGKSKVKFYRIERAFKGGRDVITHKGWWIKGQDPVWVEMPINNQVKNEKVSLNKKIKELNSEFK